MNQTVTAAVLNFDCVTVVQCSDCAVLCVIAEWKSTGCLVSAGCVFSLTCSTSSLFITHCCTGEAEGQIFLSSLPVFVFFFFFWLYSAACIPASVPFPRVSSSSLVFTFLFFVLFYFFIPGFAPAQLLPLLFSFFCLSHSYCILLVGLLDFVVFQFRLWIFNQLFIKSCFFFMMTCLLVSCACVTFPQTLTIMDDHLDEKVPRCRFNFFNK